MPKKMSKGCAAAITNNTRDLLKGEAEYLEFHLHATPKLATLLSKLAEADAAAEELLKEME